ncbi:transporter substrate-binding domain-containing protein [Roseibium aggregatum]|uniref:Transporter substrate-binding domain-containing protein n=1 Tax=Roseibium aggregatum TaxID=187304 RepID=A0A939EH98_9HYPH|nr:transporter substrate-binding domain-containing protein [Roseibium aggregatum]MBN9671514.1 transporter substrate-binding domain-containing protein [Roseibium aggregatum]
MNPTSDIAALLAPSSTLRVGINMSNKLLVSGTDEEGNPFGVSPDVGKAIADRLGVPVTYVPYPSPGAVADAADRNEWDIGNIGAEPERAKTISFTSPYCEIQATFLVRATVSHTRAAELDRPDIRIAVKDRTAYGLWLQRNFTRARLVLVDPGSDPFQVFREQGLEALAGLRSGLSRDMAGCPDCRLLEDAFTSVRQAVGTPTRNAAALPWLQKAVDDLKSSGKIREFIDRHGANGLSVAP